MKTNVVTVKTAIEKALDIIWSEVMKDRMSGDISPMQSIRLGYLEKDIATLMLDVREGNEAKCMDSACGHSLRVHAHYGECDVKGCQCKGMTDSQAPLSIEFDKLMGRGQSQSGLQD